MFDKCYLEMSDRPLFWTTRGRWIIYLNNQQPRTLEMGYCFFRFNKHISEGSQFPWKKKKPNTWDSKNETSLQETEWERQGTTSFTQQIFSSEASTMNDI